MNSLTRLIRGGALAVALASLVLALLGLGATAQPAAAAQVPQGFFGMGDWSFPQQSDLRGLSRRGLRSWRTTLAWGAVERTPGVYEFSGYDQMLRQAARRKVRVLLTIAGCPDWACDRHGPPRTAAAHAAFQRFVAVAVARYGRGGSLWGGRWAVTHWQLMNEVNGADQWPDPDPAAYAALLKSTARTIRSVDPRARVVLAGLPDKMTIWLRDYLPALYRQPGFAGDFDVMAVHGYAISARGPGKILGLTRRIMRRGGDRRKQIWMTEIGWSTGGPPFPFTGSERFQARTLRAAFSRLAACRRRWKLERVFWFSYRDRNPGGQQDYWGFHNGLRRLDGHPKPAHRQFLRVIGKAARVERCRG